MVHFFVRYNTTSIYAFQNAFEHTRTHSNTQLTQCSINHKMQFLTLAGEVVLCILFFGVVHFAVMQFDRNAYHLRSHATTSTPSQSSSSSTPEWLDALYFSLVTQSTVGYGSIVPQSTLAKTITSVQILTTLLFVIRWATLRAYGKTF